MEVRDRHLQSLESSRSVEELQRAVAHPRPYAFPKLGAVQHLNAAGEDSQPSKDLPNAPALDLAQEINEPNPATSAGETSDATSLLLNPFETALIAEPNIPMDAFKLVDLADISTCHRLRGVVGEFIPIMIASLSTHGIIQPPVIRPNPANPDKFLLVTGLQRVNAAVAAGADKIHCRVVRLSDDEAEFWEIDENLVRSALTPAQEALCIDRRRALHERLYGKAKARGAAAANLAMGRDASAKLADASPSFVEITAKRVGRSARSVQRAVQRAAQNGRSDLERVVGSSLDVGTELDALPMLPSATRAALIEQAAAGQQVSAIQVVAEAEKSPVEDGSPSDSAVSRNRSRARLAPAQPGDERIERRDPFPGLVALQTAWRKAPIQSRERFLAWIDEIKAAPATGELNSFEHSSHEDSQ